MRTGSRWTVVALVSALVAGWPGGAASQRRVPEVPYVPTAMEVVDEMLALASVGPGDVVYDLGSGDGRIVVTAAARHGARGVGYDLDASLVRRARENARAAGVEERVRFVQGDLFEADLRPATVVTLYLLASVNLKLRPRLLEELRPGTRVVSNTFSMGDWRPDSVVAVPAADDFGPRIYFWVIPARAAGSWEVAVDGRRYTLRVEQEFQKVRGTVDARGWLLPMEDAALVGDRLRFSVREMVDGRVRTLRFDGRVAGDAMEGTLRAEGAPGPAAWSARRVRAGR